MAFLSARVRYTPTEIERATMSRVMWRLIPLLMLCYSAAFLDRINVGFAGLTMNKTLGFSSAVFGFGGGIFFWGYFLFEIPSNLVLNRVGARRWIARIMITWGLVSALTAFVWSEYSFYAARFLLGVAEAGFYPGVILYVTWWFPRRYRARAVGFFMTATAASNIAGSLASGYLLTLDGVLGLHGWQWLFLVEALPPLVLGVVVLFCLTDNPAKAHWLSAEQRSWLTDRIALERQQQPSGSAFSLSAFMRDPRTWLFTLVYFGQNVTGYGLNLFMPQIMSRFGAAPGQLGLITSIPYMFGVTAIVLFGIFSDWSGRRTLTVGTACLMSCLGLALSSQLGDPMLMFSVLMIAQMGQSSIGPTFWPLPTAMISGTAAAGGIALINSVGNLGGFFGPYLMGVVRDATNSLNWGMLAISSGTLVSAVVVFALGSDKRLGRVPHVANATE